MTIWNEIKAFNVDLNSLWVSFHRFQSCFNRFRPILRDFHFQGVSSSGEKVNKVNKNDNKAILGFEKPYRARNWCKNKNVKKERFSYQSCFTPSFHSPYFYYLSSFLSYTNLHSFQQSLTESVKELKTKGIEGRSRCSRRHSKDDFVKSVVQTLQYITESNESRFCSQWNQRSARPKLNPKGNRIELSSSSPPGRLSSRDRLLDYSLCLNQLKQRKRPIVTDKKTVCEINAKSFKCYSGERH